jgi:hypothetical protein
MPPCCMLSANRRALRNFPIEENSERMISNMSPAGYGCRFGSSTGSTRTEFLVRRAMPRISCFSGILALSLS